MIATSDDWGAVKPDAPFFRAVIDSAPCDASGIVYVGDRVDNDLKPAKEAGMRTAFIRRGPFRELARLFGVTFTEGRA
jgi:FMN phosphatase YigB (HAD superfamily)